jgi:hypothetical protein
MLNKISGSILKRNIVGAVGNATIGASINQNKIEGRILSSGPVGPVGPMGPSGVSGDSSSSWAYYVLTWDSVPVQLTDNVYLYTLDSVERYRYVPTVYNPSQDIFYENFVSGVLSNPIVSRA